MDTTVLYYTASVENESFEKKIRDNILNQIGDLPLVSVSQIPIDFGHNICVGRHDNCYPNEFRQIQIGLENIHTPFVLTAEADFLYPPDYFKFVPEERGHCYRYDNIWVVFFTARRNRYQSKGSSEGAQLIDRDVWLKQLNNNLAGKKEWFNKEDINAQKYITVIKTDPKYMWTGLPAVTFKTGDSISNKTRFNHNLFCLELPYWGTAAKLIERMIG